MKYYLTVTVSSVLEDGKLNLIVSMLGAFSSIELSPTFGSIRTIDG